MLSSPRCKWECGSTGLLESCEVSGTPEHPVSHLGLSLGAVRERVSQAAPYPLPRSKLLLTTTLPVAPCLSPPLGTLELCPFCRWGIRDPQVSLSPSSTSRHSYLRALAMSNPPVQNAFPPGMHMADSLTSFSLIQVLPSQQSLPCTPI